jgi:hypothetical protein
LFAFFETGVSFWISSIIIAPYYLLVVPYATVQLFLHVTEQFLRGADLSLSFLLVGLSATVLF